MGTTLGGKNSSWKEMFSGDLQGSVLAPIMLLVNLNYINSDIWEERYMKIIGDDAKIQRKIDNETLYVNNSKMIKQN